MAPVVPFAKVAALAARQLAKPVSQILLKYSLNHPVAKERTIAVGQVLNRLNVRITRLAEGKAAGKQVLELSEDKALDAGAVFLGEVFVFGVGAFVVTSELLRAQRKNAEIDRRKEDQDMRKEYAVESKFFEGSRRIQALEGQVRDLREAVDILLFKLEQAQSTKANPDFSTKTEVV
jgi:hypothetical protein